MAYQGGFLYGTGFKNLVIENMTFTGNNNNAINIQNYMNITILDSYFNRNGGTGLGGAFFLYNPK